MCRTDPTDAADHLIEDPTDRTTLSKRRLVVPSLWLIRAGRRFSDMAEYYYATVTMGDHFERSSISDISLRLLERMRASIDKAGAEGARPLSVTISGSRIEAFDVRNNPFPAQRIEYAILARRDPSLWELDVRLNVNTNAELTQRDGAAIDDYEADGWQLIGYYRGLNSATNPKAPVSEAIWDSVAVFTRRIPIHD